MTVGIAGQVGRVTPANSVLYEAPHVGTYTLGVKNTQTLFSQYTVSPTNIRRWAERRTFLTDEFMFGVNWDDADNMINFVCTWNDVEVVNGVYARPGITGAAVFARNQNRILDFSNKMRIQAYSGDLVAPRNHARWSTNYGGTVDFGGSEEYLYGQTSVNIASGVVVKWFYYINGTGSPFVYFDHHKAYL